MLDKKITAKEWFYNLRTIICDTYLKFENKKKFKVQKWNRSKVKSEGGGEMSIFRDGKIFEKVGVNVSTVSGTLNPNFAKQIPGAKNNNNKFWASGISLVAHFKSPHIPSFHFNTRYIETSTQWFGGGMDMTPCIQDAKQKKLFHKSIKEMCDGHNKDYYNQFSKNCDKYFYLEHRQEPRGDGGIFFDYLNNNWNKNFNFVQDVGLTFLNVSTNIIRLKKNLKWNKNQKNLQLIKRGRYAEFNLLYDRGTKFGLNTGGNIEAIFMSLPPLVKW